MTTRLQQTRLCLVDPAESSFWIGHSGSPTVCRQWPSAQLAFPRHLATVGSTVESTTRENQMSIMKIASAHSAVLFGTRWLKAGVIAFALGLAIASGAVSAGDGSPGPWGIDDPRIQTGVLRTEFDDPRAGTAARPLVVDCEASANPELCADIETVFRASNSYTNRSGHRLASYWMLTVNNDKSFVERCEEGGPPDQAIPVSAPGKGLAGIAVFSGVTGNVVHLDVNQKDFPNPCGAAAAPFVGFGAYWGRGNSTPIGYLNAEGTVTAFTSRLIEYANDEGFVYARHYVYAVATWGGARHMIFVDLYGLDRHGNGSLELPDDNGVSSDWKWPYSDSWYFPGAKVAVVAAWAVGVSVLQKGSDTRYAIDWQRLFMKAWPDMPTTPIPIESVAFANEIVGAVHLHTAVSDVRQMSASPGTPTVSLAINGSARVEVEPGEQLNYAWKSENVLWVHSTWSTEDPRCGLGQTAGMWKATSPSGSYAPLPDEVQPGCSYDIVVTGHSFNGVATDGVTLVVR